MDCMIQMKLFYLLSKVLIIAIILLQSWYSLANYYEFYEMWQSYIFISVFITIIFVSLLAKDIKKEEES